MAYLLVVNVGHAPGNPGFVMVTANVKEERKAEEKATRNY